MFQWFAYKTYRYHILTSPKPRVRQIRLGCAVALHDKRTIDSFSLLHESIIIVALKIN